MRTQSEYQQLQALVYSDRATPEQLGRFKELIEIRARGEGGAELAAYRGPLRNRA